VLLALDDAGRVIGHNRRAQLLLQPASGAITATPLVGQPFERLFNATLADLGRYTLPHASDQRAITLAGSGRVLFMLASPPPVRSGQSARPAASPAEARRIPAPLAALSGGDPALDRQIERAAKLVNSPMSVLLTGETGSGKEHFAKALHQASERRARPFVAVNCAAIPETLIESELFGHLPGSFSGAGPRPKRGLIQEADGGTLFLDEIGDMPRDLQARLLRVLAEREVLPIGATKPTPVNIRVIAATHCDLEALVRERHFRDDLYYRLNGARIVLPPLRERRDLAWLIQRILASVASVASTANATGSGRELPRLSSEVSERLHAHAWPGNLRELRNVLEFACAVCSDELIGLGDLPDVLGQALLRSSGVDAAAVASPVMPPARAVEPAAPVVGDQRTWLLEQLAAVHGNVSAAARRLGISRMTMYRRMKRVGIIGQQGNE
jgi:transcriptional regulator of acetoin/glycerol metabolism